MKSILRISINVKNLRDLLLEIRRLQHQKVCFQALFSLPQIFLHVYIKKGCKIRPQDLSHISRLSFEILK